MGGDSIDHRRSAGAGRAQHSQPTLYLRRTFVCCSLLLIAIAIFLSRPIASAPTVTSVAERRIAGPDPEQLTVARKSNSAKDVKHDATKSAPAPDDQKKSNAVQPTDAKASKPETGGGQPDSQKAGSDTTVSSPETRDAKPDNTAPPSEAQTSKPEAVKPSQPEAQTAGPNSLAPMSGEQNSKPDLTAPSGVDQAVKEETATAAKQPADTATPKSVTPPSDEQIAKKDPIAPRTSERSKLPSDLAVPQLVL